MENNDDYQDFFLYLSDEIYKNINLKILEIMEIEKSKFIKRK
jgi:hypothetical protein